MRYTWIEDKGPQHPAAYHDFSARNRMFRVYHIFLTGPAMILTCLSLLFAEVLSLWMVPPSHKLIYNPNELQRYHEISTLSINNQGGVVLPA